MDLITAKGPSARHELFYFTESNLAAVRLDDYKYQFISQPGGWIGVKAHPDVPTIVNLRLDPFEKMIFPDGNTGSYEYLGNYFMYNFWRFVLVQKEVAKLAMTAIDYPPMQKGASFNLDAVKAQIEEAMRKQNAD